MSIKSNRKVEHIYDQQQYNEGIRKTWMPLWIKNMGENYSFIKNRFKEKNWDLSRYTERNSIKKYAIVLGSGPSLDKIIPHLPNWNGDIYCSSSQLLMLHAIGKKPSACFMIDSDPKMSYLVKEVDTTGINLITNPCMDPEVLKAWGGPIYFFRMWDPGDPMFNEFCPGLYYNLNKEMAIKEDLNAFGITSYALNGGCIVNTIIAITPAFGHNTLFLAGVDYGYPNNQLRFTNVKRHPHNIDWSLDDKQEGWEYVPSGNATMNNAPYVGTDGIRTDKVSIFYKYSTIQLWGMDQASLVSCSDGTLKELPYCDPETVVENQGEFKGCEGGWLTPEERYLTAKKYLKYRSIYIVNKVYKGKKRSLVIHTQQMKLGKRIAFHLKYFWNTYIRRIW